MNVRDPFNIHRRSALSILKTSAAQAAAGVTERAVEVGVHAIEKSKQAVEDLDLDMSFNIPKNVPSFGDPQRVIEDHIWGNTAVTARAGAGARGNRAHTNILAGVQDRVGGLFDNKNANTLPMYKDKPYAYPPSQRVKPLWRRKRVLGAILVLLSILYFFGVFQRGKEADKVATSPPFWGFLSKDTGHGKKVDWDIRREMVVDAFSLSWDAYERYAWGRVLL